MIQSHNESVRKYRLSHPDKIKHINDKSAAKRFVQKEAALAELLWLSDLIDQKICVKRKSGDA